MPGLGNLKMLTLVKRRAFILLHTSNMCRLLLIYGYLVLRIRSRTPNVCLLGTSDRMTLSWPRFEAHFRLTDGCPEHSLSADAQDRGSEVSVVFIVGLTAIFATTMSLLLFYCCGVHN